MKKSFIFSLILTWIIVFTLWIWPFVLNFWLEIIDGRMEISLSETTIVSVGDIFQSMKNDGSLKSYFLLLFLSFLHLKGKIVIYYALVSFFWGIGAYLYFYKFSKNSLVSSILSICYCCSLPLAVFYSSKYGIFSHLYTIIPLFWYLLYRVFTERSKFFLYALFFFILSLLIQPYNLSVYFTIGFFWIWSCIILLIHLNEKIIWDKKIIIFIFVVLLIPVLNIVSQIQSLMNLEPTQMMAVQSETYTMTNTQSTYLNTILLKWIWDFNVVWPWGYEAYSFQTLYGEKSINILYLISLCILSVFLLIYSSSREKKLLRILWWTIILLIPLIVWAKEGIFSSFYIALYDNFTPFQIFRQGYKWMPVLILVICILFALIFSHIKDQKQKGILLFAIMMFTTYNILPFALWAEIKEKSAFSIPDDYPILKKQIPKNSSILLLPEQYQASYRWGSPGWPIEIFFSTHLLFARPQPKYSLENVKYFTIIDDILHEKIQNIKWNPDFEYILVRKDFDYKTNTWLIHDPLIFRDILDKNKFQKISESENLVLYKNE